jgi:hypothetical protein
MKAVTESCGDLADFVRLMWEGLNFEFRETPRGEVVLFRGVELSEAALESYRENVGGFFAWSVFSSFTEKREEAEEYGRAWRGGIPVLFELRSVWCRRTKNGAYLLHPFAVLQVEAVVGNVVKLVEVELVEPQLVAPLPGQRRGVVPREGRWTEMHQAAKCGDVRAIARLASRPELINARGAKGWTPLVVAASCGRTEAVKALVWFGADVNTLIDGEATTVYIASVMGHERVVRVLGSLGADVNASDKDGATPIYGASQEGHASVVRALVALGADVNAPCKDAGTSLMVASLNGHAAVVAELLKAGASTKATLPDGRTALTLAKSKGHETVVALLEKA